MNLPMLSVLKDQIMKFKRNIKIGFQFSLHDWWIGLHWKQFGHITQVWVCLIPCVAVHVSWEGEIDLSAADRSCKRCHGTGIMGRKKRKGREPMRLICDCVAKATIKRDAVKLAKGFVRVGHG